MCQTPTWTFDAPEGIRKCSLLPSSSLVGETAQAEIQYKDVCRLTNECLEWRGKRFPLACLQTVLFCSCLTKDKTSITISQRLVLYYRGKKNISRACSYTDIRHHGLPGHSRQKLRGHAQFLPFSQPSPPETHMGLISNYY